MENMTVGHHRLMHRNPYNSVNRTHRQLKFSEVIEYAIIFNLIF